MKIKQLFTQQAVAVLLLMLASCQNEVVPEKTGEKIALSFRLYQAELTKAETNTSTSLAEGTMLRAYAYKKDDPTTGDPVGYGDYKIADDQGTAEAVAGGGLTLYRGEYDIYLLSYNDPNYVPETVSNNLVSVTNGKDFMYATLKGISVKPTSGGADMMSVDLPEPFTRLCSNVIVKVKANSNSPIPLSGFVVESVKINKLSGDQSYQMGETGWAKNDGLEYSGTGTMNKFGNNTTNDYITTVRESDPFVVLPSKGTEPLEFELNLSIRFNKTVEGTASEVIKLFTYKPKVYKSFLPGMTYEFEFTLTFFGDQEPADLSLAILEYTTVKFSSDDVGK